MSREILIKRTLKALSKLPEDKIQEVHDFADFILKKYDEEALQNGVEHLASESETFDFLNEEEELYSQHDLKEKY
jgi:hypothetical protein